MQIAINMLLLSGDYLLLNESSQVTVIYTVIYIGLHNHMHS